jgi:NDP-sugar pyrophosphorylase family protein
MGILKYELSEYWLDIGRIDDYEIAENAYKENFE